MLWAFRFNSIWFKSNQFDSIQFNSLACLLGLCCNLHTCTHLYPFVHTGSYAIVRSRTRRPMIRVLTSFEARKSDFFYRLLWAHKSDQQSGSFKWSAQMTWQPSRLVCVCHVALTRLGGLWFWFEVWGLGFGVFKFRLLSLRISTHNQLTLGVRNFVCKNNFLRIMILCGSQWFGDSAKCRQSQEIGCICSSWGLQLVPIATHAISRESIREFLEFYSLSLCISLYLCISLTVTVTLADSRRRIRRKSRSQLSIWKECAHLFIGRSWERVCVSNRNRKRKHKSFEANNRRRPLKNREKQTLMNIMIKLRRRNKSTRVGVLLIEIIKNQPTWLGQTQANGEEKCASHCATHSSNFHVRKRVCVYCLCLCLCVGCSLLVVTLMVTH